MPGWAVHLGDLGVRRFVPCARAAVEDDHDACVEAEASQVAVELFQGGV
jgi:hypothetical protein